VKRKLNKKKTDPSMDLKRLVYVLFGLIGLIIIYMIFVYPRTLQTQTFVDNSQDQASETLEGLARFVDVKVQTQDYDYSDWTQDNGVRIPLKGKQILFGTSTTSQNVGKYGDFTTDQLEMVNPEFLTELQDKIAEYFESNGFVQSESNTNLTPNELYFSTLGYQKDNLYCLSNLTQMSDPFGYISCGTVDNNQLKLQQELTNVLLEQQNQDLGTYPITFRVATVDGDYANGSISSIGGYQWIARKSDGVWTTVWTGQDFPLCSDMAMYEVPSSMYPGCYNPETQKTQKTY
jgi:hypothetical protein